MKYILLSLISLILCACSTTNCAHERKFNSENKTNEKMTLDKGNLNMKKVKVAKSDGTLQCSQGKKISPEEMQKGLKEIHVFSATTENDGMIRIQVCGSPTGNFNVFEILETDLEKALGYGFKRWNR